MVFGNPGDIRSAAKITHYLATLMITETIAVFIFSYSSWFSNDWKAVIVMELK